MADGELYLEYTQSEALGFDDGRIKTASFDQSQGFGLRALSGEATGFAHASELSEAAIARAAGAVRAVKEGHDGNVALAPPGTNAMLYTEDNPLGAVAFAKKAALLSEIDAYARSKDPRVRQVSASLSGQWQAVQIVHADGARVADIRPLVRLNVSIVVEENGRMETGSAGAGGRVMYDHYLDPAQWRAQVDEALRQALVNLSSVPAPAGEMVVVLGSGWPGVMLHEAVGHGLEGDFNRKKTSAFAGLLGQRVAAPGVTVVDDGTIPDRRGSLTIDDEGTPSRRNVLIEDGILKGYMQDRLNARLMGMAADRQRPAPELCLCADAAHDQHLHAGRRQGAGRDHRLGQEGPLCRQFRRRPGRHHLGQVRVLRLRGLSDRGRQGRPGGQGRDPDRQRARSP